MGAMIAKWGNVCTSLVEAHGLDFAPRTGVPIRGADLLLLHHARRGFTGESSARDISRAQRVEITRKLSGTSTAVVRLTGVTLYESSITSASVGGSAAAYPWDISTGHDAATGDDYATWTYEGATSDLLTKLDGFTISSLYSLVGDAEFRETINGNRLDDGAIVGARAGDTGDVAGWGGGDGGVATARAVGDANDRAAKTQARESLGNATCAQSFVRARRRLDKCAGRRSLSWASSPLFPKKGLAGEALEGVDILGAGTGDDFCR